MSQKVVFFGGGKRSDFSGCYDNRHRSLLTLSFKSLILKFRWGIFQLDMPTDCSLMTKNSLIWRQHMCICTWSYFIGLFRLKEANILGLFRPKIGIILGYFIQVIYNYSERLNITNFLLFILPSISYKTGQVSNNHIYILVISSLSKFHWTIQRHVKCTNNKDLHNNFLCLMFARYK